MKITENTTLAELAAYFTTLGNPSLTLMRKHPRASHGYQAVVYLTHAGSFNGDGGTYAEAIEDALGSLRSALGVTNLAYEPLNYVSERPCHGCDRAASEHPNDSGCKFWHAEPS
jgi:hypothetical protein